MKNTCAKFGSDLPEHGGGNKEHTHIHTMTFFVEIWMEVTEYDSAQTEDVSDPQ